MRRTVVAVPDHQQADAEVLRAGVQTLNELVAAADIRGCRAPAFRRSFRSDLRLGGRFHAIGDSNFQSMSEHERLGITINGEPVVEVDMRSAYLTIFLALTGTKELPTGDLYDLPGLPAGSRVAVKSWMTQTFATGKLVKHWAKNTPDAARAVSVKSIRGAAVRAYPALQNMRAILPSDLASALPADKVDWAVGRYLTCMESRIMAGALGYLQAHNVVGLPVHDSLIVPHTAVEVAKRGLTGACSVFVGITPRLKVSHRAQLRCL